MKNMSVPVKAINTTSSTLKIAERSPRELVNSNKVLQS